MRQEYQHEHEVHGQGLSRGGEDGRQAAEGGQPLKHLTDKSGVCNDQTHLTGSVSIQRDNTGAFKLHGFNNPAFPKSTKILVGGV